MVPEPLIPKSRSSVRPQRRHKDSYIGRLPHTDNIHDAREIVREHMQRHLAGDARQRLYQEVRRAHARLNRAEGVLDRLAPLAHGLRILVEPPLHGLKHMLVLPPRDPALHSCRAAALERAGSAGVGPVAAQCQSVFDVGVVVPQPFAGRAAIDVLLGQIDGAGIGIGERDPLIGRNQHPRLELLETPHLLPQLGELLPEPRGLRGKRL
jgi:hypothetical protein